MHTRQYVLPSQIELALIAPNYLVPVVNCMSMSNTCMQKQVVYVVDLEASRFLPFRPADASRHITTYSQMSFHATCSCRCCKESVLWWYPNQCPFLPLIWEFGSTWMLLGVDTSKVSRTLDLGSLSLLDISSHPSILL